MIQQHRQPVKLSPADEGYSSNSTTSHQQQRSVEVHHHHYYDHLASTAPNPAAPKNVYQFYGPVTQAQFGDSNTMVSRQVCSSFVFFSLVKFVLCLLLFIVIKPFKISSMIYGSFLV